LPSFAGFAKVGWLVRARGKGIDPLEDLGRLLAEAAAAREQSRAAAAGAVSVRGSDSTQVVTVSLDGDGHVAAVHVAAGWRQQLDPEDLGDAVREAVQAAAVARLAAWGEAYADEPVAATTAPVGNTFAKQLNEVATARMSSADGRAALLELLAMAEAVERGLDEVSGRLQSTVDATHTGRSADRHVTVTVTGGGDVTGVRYDRGWLRDAHEVNIGRQTVSAFAAAYASAARSSVDRLIAESSLGKVQRAAQDPFGLARRLRLHD
jgi:DNA-binding protein YbaB